MKKTKKMGEMTFRYDFFYQFLTFIERRTPGGGALFSGINPPWRAMRAAFPSIASLTRDTAPTSTCFLILSRP